MHTLDRFRPAKRINESLLSAVERRALRWFAQRMPRVINSDHLSALGLLAMAGAGAAYAAAAHHPGWLLVGILCLALNWLGDSLDGTLARYRNQQRPRYGFYVDHVIDALGASFLLGGLALSGYIAPGIAAGLLIAYLLLAIHVYLVTYTRGKFHLALWNFGATELRIGLAIGNLALFIRGPMATIGGREYRLFDVGGSIAIVLMSLAFLFAVARNTVALYREEPLR